MLLIEFYAGGLYPFLPVDQAELVDSTYHLGILDKNLMKNLKFALEESRQINTPIEIIDKIFITQLMKYNMTFDFSPIMKNIIKQHGNINISDLAFPYYYSERQTRRLFLRYAGINPKKLTRIARANYALKLIKNQKSTFLDISNEAGYFDQAHFFHEFKIINGITPLEYKQNMSVFYNDKTRI